MSVLPDWLDRSVAREKLLAGLYDGIRIELTAISSLRDLERLAVETARTNNPATAATNLYGGHR